MKTKSKTAEISVIVAHTTSKLLPCPVYDFREGHDIPIRNYNRYTPSFHGIVQLGLCEASITDEQTELPRLQTTVGKNVNQFQPTAFIQDFTNGKAKCL